jgi:hypothetical protein
MKKYLNDPSRSLARLSLFAAAFVLAPAALAQQPAEPPASPPAAAAPEQAVEVSDQEIETFATIYVDLQETADKFEQEMAEVESEQEAQEVQTKMQQESIEKLDKHGWTADQFNRVAQAVNQNPALIEKTLQAIEDKS